MARLAAAGVVRELMESAILMARQAMTAVGVDTPEIDRTEDLYRRRDRERLKIQHEAGDIRAARAAIIAAGGWNEDQLTKRERPDPLPGPQTLGADCG